MIQTNRYIIMFCCSMFVPLMGTEVEKNSESLNQASVDEAMVVVVDAQEAAVESSECQVTEADDLQMFFGEISEDTEIKRSQPVEKTFLQKKIQVCVAYLALMYERIEKIRRSCAAALSKSKDVFKRK